MVVWIVTGVVPASGQEEINRAVKIRVAPVYPDLARRMKIVGVVRVEITVGANGSVKNAKLVGGHPVLANAALEAVKKWPSRLLGETQAEWCSFASIRPNDVGADRKRCLREGGV
jgi:TonB family protein